MNTDPSGSVRTGERRVAILLSGRGSNMMALVERARGYRVALVASDKPDAPGLAWAADNGLPTWSLSPRGIGKPAYEAALIAELERHGIETIALAGYMRLLSATFVERYRNNIINIHPSLLPLYKGLDTHARVIAAGDTHTGCSVHLVTEELDAGAVLGQARVAIAPGDTPDTLAARVLVAEHALYPQILAEFVMSPLDRVSATALLLPETIADGTRFTVAGEPFATVEGEALRLRSDAGWEDVSLAGDVDWQLIEDRIARSWELAAPAGLLEAGGR